MVNSKFVCSLGTPAKLRVRGEQVLEASLPRTVKCTVAEVSEVLESSDKRY